MHTACSSQILIPVSKKSYCNIAEDNKLHSHHREELRTWTYRFLWHRSNPCCPTCTQSLQQLKYSNSQWHDMFRNSSRNMWKTDILGPYESKNPKIYKKTFTELFMHMLMLQTAGQMLIHIKCSHEVCTILCCNITETHGNQMHAGHYSMHNRTVPHITLASGNMPHRILKVF
jgi:hypothetical protein